jgi:TRAP-type C4-dicarboxylate transport system permease small subunit
MKKLIAKPYLLFFWLAPISILLAYIFKNDEISINYYDANFNVELKYIYEVAAFYFCLIGFNYFSIHWANKTPKKGLTIIHIALQVVSFTLFITHKNWNWLLSSNQTNEGLVVDNSNFILFISFLCFLLATFFHLVNFFLSLFSKSK